MWYIHIVEYYSAMERKAVVMPGTTWMTPENITLTERRTKKAMYCINAFI